MPQGSTPTNSFGRSLIETLARQLGADVAIKPVDPSGTRVEICLPRTATVTAL
jgi:two-component sensor histidine kinase